MCNHLSTDLYSSGVKKPARALLDNITRFVAAPAVGSDSGVWDGVLNENWGQSQKWQLQAVAKSLLPDSRLSICMHNIRGGKSEVDVHRSADSGRAYYSNLMVCGSVWACPVCAAKIQAVRAAEVRAAIDAHVATGGAVVMATFTVPHSRGDDLGDLLQRFNDAVRKLRQQRAYVRLSEAFGIVGSIRALEVTYSWANGWHPHVHMLLFLESGVDLSALHAAMFPLWSRVSASAGFGRVSPDAFHLGDAAAVKTYLTKMGAEYLWSAEHELVKANSKRGGVGSYTPFDLLRAQLDASDPRLAALFVEYARVFKGRKQLVWSRGLRARLLGDVGATDEQVASSIGKNDEVLAHIPLADWRIIRRRRLQSVVLAVVEEFGADGLHHLLAVYRSASVKTSFCLDTSTSQTLEPRRGTLHGFS